ncbi:MAG TPA: carbamoyltransferase HypF [Candidatus Hydrogenedentes bacterium]|nr:carbamoyltransferase HypF [Candidatus Hydrogenedentota bacterium]
MGEARVHARVQGAVQGVGFRPFIYRIARKHQLTGHVMNVPDGVILEAEGQKTSLDAFLLDLEQEKPPLSLIDQIEVQWINPVDSTLFEIRHSEGAGDPAALIMADVATCADCLQDIHNPKDRRYRYPFTNCTNCGPRFTILHRLPYDRMNTTMRGFAMCPECQREYNDPGDRRFHAQPTACPACGPQLALWDAEGREQAMRDEALLGAAQSIREGRIVAVKGLGGFHLVVDARNEEAIRRLRTHKHREEKPFALMYPTLEQVRMDVEISELEQRLLQSPECPIVLMHRKAGGISDAVAPECPRLGVMLPYTPLHHLLLEALGFPIVATSGNLSEEPICTNERDALDRLHGIAEIFLVHNRPIARHVDDSIVQVAAGREMVLRRSRGYAPLPVKLPPTPEPLAAFGAHLKNTVAIAKNSNAFLSQHIGDLETPRAFDAFLEAAQALETLYDARPIRAVCDLHPDYLASKHARGLGVPVTEVQHHYAHVLACMAEHGLTGPVLGVAWDGTGFGPDGTIWGGEFLRATPVEYERVAWLRTFHLPGGDAAVKEPRRSALGILYAIDGDAAFDRKDLPPLTAFSETERKTIKRMLARNLNSPETSSAGRLFDAVAALVGLHPRTRFEGQAAMALEYAAHRSTVSTPIANMKLTPSKKGITADWEPMIRAIITAKQSGTPIDNIAAGFHAALAHGIVDVAKHIGLKDIVLSGGCFQNTLLTEWTIQQLRENGFTPHWHHRIPPNDGGIALGQVFYGTQHIID